MHNTVYGNNLNSSGELSEEAVRKVRAKSLQKFNSYNKVYLIQSAAEALGFRSNSFDYVIGSAILHHTDFKTTAQEIHRILKKGGLLITSTDYWEHKLDMTNKIAYDNPIFIFDKKSIQNLLDKAYNKGFRLFGSEIDLNCQDKVVHWKRFGLKFTFLIFCLQKE